eukprot:2227799-Pleurochrysis_carterae.AAC.2
MRRRRRARRWKTRHHRWGVVFLGRGVVSRGAQQVSSGVEAGFVRRVGLYGRRARTQRAAPLSSQAKGHGAISVGEECIADSGVGSVVRRSGGGEGDTAGCFGGFVRRRIALALWAVSMPVCTAAVAAFPKTFVISSRRIRAFRVGLRVVLLLLTGQFGLRRSLVDQKCTSIGAIKFEVALNLACLCRTQYVADRLESQRQIAGSGLELKLDVEQGACPFLQASHNGSELFSQKSIAESRVRSLNSVTEGSASPFNRRASIMDSIASPAEAEDALASATSARINRRPLLEQRARYVARVAGDSIVKRMLSINWRSKLSSISGEITW